MAGLLDSARDFERWLAAIEAQRPISHPMPLDVDEMYRRYLEQKFQQVAPPYQARQMPAALAEVVGDVTSRRCWAMGTAASSCGFRQPQPPAAGEPFASRMTGPPSRNVIDERTPITAEDVSNWLRKPYAEDEDWRSTWIGGGNGFLR